MGKNFLGKKLLIIVAHPDDESYTAAGTIYKNHLAGGYSVLICATLGEKGKSHLPKAVSDAKLKAIRRRELAAACRFLHIEKLFTLGLPDGRVGDHQNKLGARCIKIATRTRPDAVLSFGRDGITGHLDHVAAGRAARAVARKLALPFFSFSLPPRAQKDAMTWLSGKRKNGRYLQKVTYSKPNLTIKINGKVKKRALAFHRSQMDGSDSFTGFPAYAVREWLAAEYFVYDPNNS